MEKIIIFIMLLILFGLGIEKLFHMEYDITNVTIALKNDTKKFLNAVFSEPVYRHFFQDERFLNDLDMITQRYADRCFAIQKKCDFKKNVPMIIIRFVPDHELVEDELITLTTLLHTKFKEYIVNENLQWDSFAEYSCGTDYTYVYLYYKELDCDREPYQQLYKQYLRQKNSKNENVLCDDELEEELRNVH